MVEGFTWAESDY